MVAIKTGGVVTPLDIAQGRGDGVPARPEQRTRRLRPARLRPPHAGDERPLERVQRVQQGRLVTRRRATRLPLSGGRSRASRSSLAGARRAQLNPKLAQARRACDRAATCRALRHAWSGTRRATARRTFPPTRQTRTTRETSTSTSSPTTSTTRASRPPGRRTTHSTRPSAQAVRDRGMGTLGHRRPALRRADGRLRQEPSTHGAARLLLEQAGLDLGPREQASQSRCLSPRDHAARPLRQRLPLCRRAILVGPCRVTVALRRAQSVGNQRPDTDAGQHRRCRVESDVSRETRPQNSRMRVRRRRR